MDFLLAGLFPVVFLCGMAIGYVWRGQQSPSTHKSPEKPKSNVSNSLEKYDVVYITDEHEQKIRNSLEE